MAKAPQSKLTDSTGTGFGTAELLSADRLGTSTGRRLHFILKIKVGQIFDELETELKSYPKTQVEAAISDTKSLMTSFVSGIFHEAIEKDRILRGDGINFPQRDITHATDTAVFPEIEQRAIALRALFASPEHSTWISKTEFFLKEHKEIVAILLLLGGALGTAALEVAKLVLRKIGWFN